MPTAAPLAGREVPQAERETPVSPEQQTAQNFLENFSIEILPRHLPPVSYTHLTLPTKRIV